MRGTERDIRGDFRRGIAGGTSVPPERHGFASSERDIASETISSSRPHSRSCAPARSAGQPIVLGTCVKQGVFTAPAPSVFYDAPELAAHRERPWLIAHILQRFGLDLRTPRQLPSMPFAIPRDTLAHHAALFGSSGKGKTRLTLHLVREQMRAGCSVLMLDFKADTIQQTVAIAREAGIPLERITVLWPDEASFGMPEWNPFAVPFPQIKEAVGRFVDLVRATNANWGPQLGDLLKNAAIVVAALGRAGNPYPASLQSLWLNKLAW